MPAWQADGNRRSELMQKLGAAIVAAADELAEDCRRRRASRFRLPLPSRRSATCPRSTTRASQCREVLQDDENAMIELTHCPLGVVAAITPWNFPLGLAMWKLAPALRGAHRVLKPSPYTPLATLRLGETINQLLPSGVVNVVTGGDDLGPR